MKKVKVDKGVEFGGEGLVFVWPLWDWLCRLFSGG